MCEEREGGNIKASRRNIVLLNCILQTSSLWISTSNCCYKDSLIVEPLRVYNQYVTEYKLYESCITEIDFAFHLFKYLLSCDNNGNLIKATYSFLIISIHQSHPVW
jgi:hypothetical protein